MGAAVDMLKSPRAMLAVVAVFLVLIILPITFVGIFLIEFPALLSTSITAAVTTAYDDLVVGWESLENQGQQRIDNFLTWLTTGDTGDASDGFAQRMSRRRRIPILRRISAHPTRWWLF